MAEEAPTFRKHDRYKASSYRTYNFKMPARYDTWFWMRFCQISLVDRAIIEELRPQIGSLAILDVGCATGRLLAGLARAGATSLAGTDLAPRILDVAREKLVNERVHAEFRAADAEDSLPWPAEHFDVAMLTGVFHHFYRPHDALREVRRVLRPGGRILLVDPCFFPILRQALNLCFRIAPHAGDYRFYSRRGAVELLEAAGFRCSQARRVGLWWYFITAAKVAAAEGAA